MIWLGGACSLASLTRMTGQIRLDHVECRIDRKGKDLLIPSRPARSRRGASCNVASTWVSEVKELEGVWPAQVLLQEKS